jgi:hypothetical protein
MSKTDGLKPERSRAEEAVGKGDHQYRELLATIELNLCAIARIDAAAFNRTDELVASH